MPARLRRWLRLGSTASVAVAAPPVDPLLGIGRELRQRREARGLSLRQLALETRISTPVLEALERGWRDRLPEPAYLRTMLPLIERHLDLQPGSLDGYLPSTDPNPRHGRARESLLRRFTPGSIEVFSSWQGTVLYGLITLGLIYGLNLEQQRLAAEGLVALNPIPPLPMRELQRPAQPEATLLARLPDLRPLERPPLPEMLRRVAGQRPPGPATPPAASVNGVLVLRLQQPTRLTLSSASGPRTALQGATGELTLPLTGGFQLQLDPPPAGTGPEPAVAWNGVALKPLPGQPAGRYGVGVGAAAPRRP